MESNKKYIREILIGKKPAGREIYKQIIILKPTFPEREVKKLKITSGTASCMLVCPGDDKRKSIILGVGVYSYRLSGHPNNPDLECYEILLPNKEKCYLIIKTLESQKVTIELL